MLVTIDYRSDVNAHIVDKGAKLKGLGDQPNFPFKIRIGYKNRDVIMPNQGYVLASS